jgi:hypothetical protein
VQPQPSASGLDFLFGGLPVALGFSDGIGRPSTSLGQRRVRGLRPSSGCQVDSVALLTGSLVGRLCAAPATYSYSSGTSLVSLALTVVHDFSVTAIDQPMSATYGWRGPIWWLYANTPMAY